MAIPAFQWPKTTSLNGSATSEKWSTPPSRSNTFWHPWTCGSTKAAVTMNRKFLEQHCHSPSLFQVHEKTYRHDDNQDFMLFIAGRLKVASDTLMIAAIRLHCLIWQVSRPKSLPGDKNIITIRPHHCNDFFSLGDLTPKTNHPLGLFSSWEPPNPPFLLVFSRLQVPWHEPEWWKLTQVKKIQPDWKQRAHS